MDDDQPTDTSKFGAAAPMVDPIAKAYDAVRGFFKNVPGKSAPPQTVDHSTGADPGMVNEANESFRKKPDTATQPTGKTPVQRKVLRKAPTKR